MLCIPSDPSHHSSRRTSVLSCWPITEVIPLLEPDSWDSVVHKDEVFDGWSKDKDQ